MTYFDSFGVENIPKAFSLQAQDSVMCGYFCMGFIDLMLKDKSLIDFTKTFLHQIVEKYGDIILN